MKYCFVTFFWYGSLFSQKYKSPHTQVFPKTTSFCFCSALVFETEFLYVVQADLELSTPLNLQCVGTAKVCCPAQQNIFLLTKPLSRGMSKDTFTLYVCISYFAIMFYFTLTKSRLRRTGFLWTGYIAHLQGKPGLLEPEAETEAETMGECYLLACCLAYSANFLIIGQVHLLRDGNSHIN